MGVPGEKGVKIWNNFVSVSNGHPIYLDDDKKWFEVLHGTDEPTVKSPLISTLFSPQGFYALFCRKRGGEKGKVAGMVGGEAAYLGGLLLLDKEGKEVWRYKESFYGDTVETEEVEKVVRGWMC